jgi:hypothetical protein
LSFNGSNRGADPVRVTEGTEKQTWISLPVAVQYALYEKGITNVFVAGGITADYLLSSSLKIVTNRGQDNSSVPENSVDRMEQRNAFNTGVIVAAGFKRKIGKGFLIVEARYKMGLLPVSTKADTYENAVILWDNKYVDGIFRLNSVTLSAGYVLNRYHPKKLHTR